MVDSYKQNQDLVMGNIETTIKGVKSSFYQIADEKAKKSIDNMELALKDIQSTVGSVCAIGPVKRENKFAQDVLDALKEVALAMDKSANSPESNEQLEIQDRAFLAIINELTKDEYLYIIEDAIKFLEEYVDVVGEAVKMFRKGDIPLPEPPKSQTYAERRAERNRQEQENLETLTKIFNTLRDAPRGVQKVVGLMRKIEQLTEEVMIDNAYSQEKVKEITSKFREIYIALDLVDTLADMAYDLLHPIDYVKNALDNRKKPQYDEPADYIEY